MYLKIQLTEDDLCCKHFYEHLHSYKVPNNSYFVHEFKNVVNTIHQTKIEVGIWQLAVDSLAIEYKKISSQEEVITS